MSAFDDLVEKVRVAAEVQPTRRGERGCYFNDYNEPVCLIGWALDALGRFKFHGLDIRTYPALNHSPITKLLVSEATTKREFKQMSWLQECQFNQDSGDNWFVCVAKADAAFSDTKKLQLA